MLYFFYRRFDQMRTRACVSVSFRSEHVDDLVPLGLPTSKMWETKKPKKRKSETQESKRQKHKKVQFPTIFLPPVNENSSCNLVS